MKQEAEKRYKACVKHYSKGLLDVAYFDDLDEAHCWLMKSWAKAPHDDSTSRILLGGAIYDQHEKGRRVYLLGDEMTLERPDAP